MSSESLSIANNHVSGKPFQTEEPVNSTTNSFIFWQPSGSAVLNPALFALRKPQLGLWALKLPTRRNGDGCYSTRSCRCSAYCLESGKSKQQIVIFSGCNKLTATAVSYTHLDVYKRQEHDFIVGALST